MPDFPAPALAVSPAQLSAELDALDIATTPAQLHGALTGWLAGGGALSPQWLREVMADDALPQVPAHSALHALATATEAALDDPELGFEPLLPEDDVPARGNALFDWCRHFLGAFGLSGAANAGLSEEGEEALGDLSRLAHAVAEPGDDEEDEAALTEIEEFVRVAVLLIAGDARLAQARRRLH